MKLTFSPVRMDQTLTALVAGDELTLNGEVTDLSHVTEDAPLTDHGHPWIAGPVRRIEGDLHLTLILPHGANAPSETLFPMAVEVTQGAVALPPYSLAAPDHPEDADVPPPDGAVQP